LGAGYTPVLLAYSLGKSQELLCGLADTGLNVALEESAHRMTRIYEALGVTFPPYAPWDGSAADNRVVIAPPGARQLAELRRTGRCRTAVVTGWAMDRGCRFRYSVDAAFPLSDHADYPGLLEMVRRVEPRRVYTVHGFAVEFASDLRELGVDAWALGQEEQLALPLRSK
jgi:Cft2 family RNA processing exonuclease